jgi:streptomycin 6-kinase
VDESHVTGNPTFQRQFNFQFPFDSSSDPNLQSKYDWPRFMPFDNHSAVWHLSTGLMIIPEQLSANCRHHGERQAWLDSLPTMLEVLTRRWSLRLGLPFEHANVTCSWVAPVICTDGLSAVLKLGMPHMEGASEIQGLRFWNGNPTMQLLEADQDLGAMLLERCQPGDSLHSEPEHKQDRVIATLLKRLWRRSPSSNDLQSFRHLSEMLAFWRDETLAQVHHWSDAGLVREGLQLWEALGRPLSTDVLLATDLHAGNVLRSEREPWLVIDPKPFIGDPPYDVVQHLHNCEARLQADPIGMVKRLADLCEVDTERLQLWTFARAAADPRPDWGNTIWIDVARALAP